MRNWLAYLGIMGLAILSVSCASLSITPTIMRQHRKSLATSAEERVSGAPAGTVTLHLNQPRYERGADFLLTLSNSTAESTQLPLSDKDDCYGSAFTFYMKRETGWQLMLVPMDTRCRYYPPGELIPAGFEKELNLRTIAGSRTIPWSRLGDDLGPASYTLRLKYTNAEGQEFLLYTDEFNQGAPVPIDEFGITVENAASSALHWKVTNHLDQSVWLASLCSSPYSESGVDGIIDQARSTLQYLTEAWSWFNLPITCKLTRTVIEIPQGETMMIDGRRWFEDAGFSLQPGQYRWDLVFFLYAEDTTESPAVGKGRHIFSPPFSIEN
jgi:hypothetical protein